MESFKIVVEPFDFVFMIFGSMEVDTDLDWSPDSLFGVADGAVAVGVDALPVGKTIDATIRISQTYEKLADTFLEHCMLVSSAGIEIVDVVETEREGRKGVVGLIYELPWSGWTTLQFRAPRGFSVDDQGYKEPKELEILITPRS